MGLAHGSAQTRGKVYWLDRAVIDLLPSSADSLDMKLGLRLLAEAIPIKESRRVKWTTAFALALINHLVIVGRPYAMKGSVKAELLSIVSTLADALQNVPEAVPLYFLPFKTDPTPEQLAWIRQRADKSSPEVRRGLLAMLNVMENPRKE